MLCVVCAVSLATWLLFTDVLARCFVLCLRCPGSLGSCSPVCPLRRLCRVCGVLGHLDPGHRCAPLVLCVVCAVSWATWLLFTGVLAWCVVLRERCRGPLGSCSPLCSLGALCCVCGVLGHLAPVHLCARLLGRVACAVSWASCSPACWLGTLCCVCGVLSHLAPVHRCVCWVVCIACVVSLATWLLFSSVLARCILLCVLCRGSLCSCPPLCWLCALCRVCGVLGPLASAHRCARSVCCVACAVSWAIWLPFTGVLTRALRCVCGVLGLVAPFHRFARSVRFLASAVSWASWLLFTGVLARCFVLCVRCPGPLGSCSQVCSLGAFRCVCGVLGHLAPVHRCARLVLCAACAVSWAACLLFTGVLARCFD